MKKKTCKEEGCDKYIWARGLCKGHDMVYNPKKYMLDRAKVKKVIEKSGKAENVASLKKKLDTIFSLYIRLRNADSNGMVQCFTSGKIMHYKEAHAGHFISRRHLATRWDETNVQVQSVKENIFNQGNAPMFAVNLDEKFGIGTAKKLVEKSNNISKITPSIYKILINEYQIKVNDLKQKLGVE